MSTVVEISWSVVSIVAAFCSICLILIVTLWIACKACESCLFTLEGREESCGTCRKETPRKCTDFGVERNNNVPTSAKTEALLDKERKSATEDGGEE